MRLMVHQPQVWSGSPLTLADARQAFAMALRDLLARNPFNRLGLIKLQQLVVDKDATLATCVFDSATLRRARWLTGGVNQDPLPAIEGFETFADAWAWHFATTMNAAAQPDLASIDRLIRHHGHLPDVALLFVIVSCQIDTWPAGWLDGRSALVHGLGKNILFGEFLDALTPGPSGERFLRLADTLWPHLIAAWRAGRRYMPARDLRTWDLPQDITVKIIATCGRLKSPEWQSVPIREPSAPAP